MTLYDTLGVSSDADAEVIRKAFRDKAKTEHPDAGGTAESFAKLNHAHAVLRDPVKRAKYDQDGQTEFVTDPLADALNLINSLIQTALVQDADPCEIDLMAALKLTIAKDTEELRAKMAPFTRAKNRAKRMLTRFSGQNAGRMNAMLKWHLDQIDENIHRIETAIATRNQATGILNDVAFRWDEPMEARMTAVVSDEMKSRAWRFGTA